MTATTTIRKPQLHVLVVVTSLLIQLAMSQVDETIASEVDVNWSTIKTHVKIMNWLGDGSTMKVHCKSIDDDLGLQVLGQHSSWSFSFKPNVLPPFWGPTVFFCHFTWPQRQSRNFRIYDDDRDGVRRGKPPCIDCFWDITKDGPCRFNQVTNAFDICYWWDGHPKGKE